jgi:GNAT superfamily N-acetyltransferase
VREAAPSITERRRTIVTTSANTVSAPIRTLTTDDRERALAVLTLAFSTDPPSRWSWPDPRVYLATFPEFALAIGGAAFEQGTAHGVGDLAGVALWLPPGVRPDEDAMGALFQRTVRAEKLADAASLFEQMGAYHPREPHWYLPLIGVDPVCQGGGLGSRLLAHALAQCDRDGALAYLESSNPANIPVYARHGFDVLGTIQQSGSPTITPMLRKPR